MEARAWAGLTESYDRLGAHAQASAAAERRRELAHALDERRDALWAATDAARQTLLAGDGPKGLDLLSNALIDWQTEGDRYGESATRVLLGGFHTSTGDADAARAQLSPALEFFETDGDVHWYASVLGQYGNYYNTFGERQRAVETFSRAVTLVRSSDRRVEASLRHDFGTLYNMLGEYELARTEFTRSLRLARQSGDLVIEAYTLMNLGTNFADLDDLPRASRYLALSRPLLRKLGDAAAEAILLNNLATVWRDSGQPLRALEAAETAHGAFVDLAFRRGQMVSATGLGLLLCDARRYEEGRLKLREALWLARDLTDRAQEALALAYKAECDAGEGDLAAARAGIDEAQTLVERQRTEILRDDLQGELLFYGAAGPRTQGRHPDAPGRRRPAGALAGRRFRGQRSREGTLDARAPPGVAHDERGAVPQSRHSTRCSGRKAPAPSTTGGRCR